MIDNSYIPDTLSQVFSVTTESCEKKLVLEKEKYALNEMEIPIFQTKIVPEETSKRVTQAQMVATTEFVSQQ